MLICYLIILWPAVSDICQIIDHQSLFSNNAILKIKIDDLWSDIRKHNNWHWLIIIWMIYFRWTEVILANRTLIWYFYCSIIWFVFHITVVSSFSNSYLVTVKNIYFISLLEFISSWSLKMSILLVVYLSHYFELFCVFICVLYITINRYICLLYLLVS